MKSTVVNPKNIWSGVIGGIFGGIAFGFILMRMGTLANAGKLLGLHDALSGFIIHLIFSAIVGLIFALIFRKGCTTFYNSSLWGIFYGIIWWFIGPLILCPWLAGATMTWSQETITHALPMLVGHLVYGFVLSVTYFWMKSRK